jgi:Flp pilus assembly protein TadG
MSPSFRDARGQGLLEFALVLPVLLIVLFGVVDFGRAIYGYSTAGQAARAGSRVAIVEQTPAAVQSAAILAATALSLTPADVDVCFKTATTAQRNCSSPATDACTPQLGCLAIVTVRAPFTPLTPIIGSIVGPITLTSTSIEPIEYVCPTAGHSLCP